ncbi:MAG: hemerythrin domain-containing protein [Chloroflexi bacterium]|nr:hemerythrin domain-containing protein [Chloroflexota bacterium]
MKPIDELMAEHRLIERMVALIEDPAAKINNTDIAFGRTLVDFLRTYADKTHHGKEEDILFRELGKKHLQAEHQEKLDELLGDHTNARTFVKRLRDAIQGGSGPASEIRLCLRELAKLYPAHITREEKFFYFCPGYFTQAEQDAMLEEFWEYDRKMIHEKYDGVVVEWEERRAETGVPSRAVR